MRALLVRPGEQAEIITLYDAHDIQSQLNQIKEYVGGWFESLPAPLGHFLFVNEEARLIGLPPNRIASELYGTTRPNGTTLLGHVLVVGPVDAHGDNTDVTDEFIERSRKAGYMQNA